MDTTKTFKSNFHQTPKMKPALSSETSIVTLKSTRCHNAENIVCSHCHENPESQIKDWGGQDLETLLITLAVVTRFHLSFFKMFADVSYFYFYFKMRRQLSHLHIHTSMYLI